MTRHGEPSLARRLVLAAVIALLLGGSTTLIIRYASTSHHPIAVASPTASPTVDPPVVPVVEVPSLSPGPVPSPVAHRRTTPPGATPSAVPAPSPSPSHVPLYRTPKGGMCRYIDFGPMMAASTMSASDSKPEVVSETKPGDPGASRWYLCLGGTGNIGARWMGVEVYPDRATAAIRYAQEKATQAPAGMDPVRNLGDDAYAFYLGTSTIYKLVVVKANLFILVVLQQAYPVQSRFKAAAIGTAQSILEKLPAT